MLKTKQAKASALTVNCKVAVPTGEPYYVKSTRGFTKKDNYVIVEVKSIIEIDENTLGMDVVSDCGKIGLMQADKNEVLDFIIDPLTEEEPAKKTKKTVKG